MLSDSPVALDQNLANFNDDQTLYQGSWGKSKIYFCSIFITSICINKISCTFYLIEYFLISYLNDLSWCLFIDL
jgi:hypothetical protein